MNSLVFRLKTLTPIWTGGVEGKPDKLHLTGIKGSIRWWYEALVRGLGGYACNPASKIKEYKCEFNTKSFQQTTDLNSELRKICPACQLFGCTNWSGKFVLKITYDNNIPITEQLSRDSTSSGNFILKFIERKEFSPVEVKLINATVKLIVEYGALGGRTTLKPSETPYKNCESYHKKNHLDYGLIAYQKGFSIQQNNLTQFTSRIKNNENDYPDLNNFWFISGVHIDRVDHNRLVKRKDSYPKEYRNNASGNDVFMGGYIRDDKNSFTQNLKSEIANRNIESEGESKKIFSFHGLAECIKTNCIKQIYTPRCFGYARNITERDNIIREVKTILDKKGNSYTLKTGEEVRNEF